jgi:UDP-N-acetylglucosamine:LPS N-acetylglucosamine transferase
LEVQHKNILVAPLNWGLGHATRCIPVIRNLQECGYNPIIASDGAALELLKLEFPNLKFLELPSYRITYPKCGNNFRWKMLQSVPNIIRAVVKERNLVKKWVKDHALSGIISDNRLGVYNPKIPCVFMTHQLNVLTGSTTFLTTSVHQHFISKFNECWVPDVDRKPNLSGKLGHIDQTLINLKYIGALSRFRKIKSDVKNDLLVLLSGPEPQRSFLEQKLIAELQQYKGSVVFVKGVVAKQQHCFQSENIFFYNFMQSAQLEQTLNESKLVLCRSGYTSVMDLAKLRKKAFFIPTPGQFEQEYLAQKFQKERLVPFCNQDDFSLKKLEEVEQYKGLIYCENEVSWKKLFSLFEGK